MNKVDALNATYALVQTIQSKPAEHKENDSQKGLGGTGPTEKSSNLFR
jgi:hypothetical protein